MRLGISRAKPERSDAGAAPTIRGACMRESLRL